MRTNQYNFSSVFSEITLKLLNGFFRKIKKAKARKESPIKWVRLKKRPKLMPATAIHGRLG